jgi:circadian clock protein KaiB
MAADLPHEPAAAETTHELYLYVAGQTAKSLAARANLLKLCDQHLAGRCTIEVVDLLIEPARAASDQIFAIPTLVRRKPAPVRKIIGDLSDTRRVLDALGIPSAS